MPLSLLNSLRVVEYGELVSAPYCGRLLADYGAHVIKVEDVVGGDASRHVGPFPRGEPDYEQSGTFLALNANKLGVTLDVTKPAGREMLRALLSQADVFIENYGSAVMARLGLTFAQLRESYPRLVVVSITPFGLEGPYAGFGRSELITQALGGYLGVTPWPFTPAAKDCGPLRMPGSFSGLLAGLNAAAGALVAIWARRTTGRGQQVDVAEVDYMVKTLDQQIAAYVDDGIVCTRHVTFGGDARWAIVPCKDGYAGIMLLLGSESMWERFRELLGAPEWFHLEAFRDGPGRAANWDALIALTSEWSRCQAKMDVYHRAQALGLPFSAVKTLREVADSSQLKARGFFSEVIHPKAGKLRVPGRFAKSSADRGTTDRAAPLLGEHNSRVYCDELGLSAGEVQRLHRVGVV